MKVLVFSYRQISSLGCEIVAAPDVFECSDPPCIHVVVDYSRKRLAVFLETSDGDIIFIPFDRLEQAYKTASSLLARRFREAQEGEIDELAREYLGAEPVEEE